jgi:hypothetical protein
MMDELIFFGMVLATSVSWYVGAAAVNTVVLTVSTLVARRQMVKRAEQVIAQMAERKKDEGEPAQAPPNQGRHGHYA